MLYDVTGGSVGRASSQSMSMPPRHVVELRFAGCAGGGIGVGVAVAVAVGVAVFVAVAVAVFVAVGVSVGVGVGVLVGVPVAVGVGVAVWSGFLHVTPVIGIAFTAPLPALDPSTRDRKCIRGRGGQTRDSRAGKIHAAERHTD